MTTAYVDPRVRRTRSLLERAMDRLLGEKSFEKISVGDVAEAATVNRATFYAHFPDKESLLESTVQSQFEALLAQRGIAYETGCTGALQKIALAVCDYLVQMRGCPSQRQLELHMELALIAVLERLLLDGLRRHSEAQTARQEMVAAMVASGIYGAARQWLRSAERTTVEEAAAAITEMLAPVLHG